VSELVRFELDEDGQILIEVDEEAFGLPGSPG
jgi:hypothetical protein